MKIGIISEFRTQTVNYGNHLQAYALNAWLRNYVGAEVESLTLATNQQKHYTDLLSWDAAKRVGRRLTGKPSAVTATKPMDPVLVADRLERFAEFRETHIPHPHKLLEKEDLALTDYDVMIVGSDVVWQQLSPHSVIKPKFLDFKAKKPFKRIAYAPSFGTDYIPRGNRKYIRKCLDRFTAVSVREHSSVEMLQGIGVEHVAYCVDPTLLLTAGEWEALEQRPAEVKDGDKYLFVYLLGDDATQREAVKNYAKKKGLTVVMVPHANARYVPADAEMEGIKVNACAIENWLWLIHHAELVVTDSFHGTVFSTIFQRKFVVLKRVVETIDINNRMKDYLHQIGQEDKALPADRLEEADSLVWDYDQIGEAISIRRQNSIQFLKNALGD